jgi:hypothetical protein
LPIADCRLKKCCGHSFQYSSAIDNRKSATPAILGQATIAEILRKKRRSLKPVLDGAGLAAD